MSLKVNLDFKGVQITKFGTGTAGAKSLYLDRFKSAAEQLDLSVPGFSYFTEEFFLAPYVRKGVLDEKRALLVSPETAFRATLDLDSAEKKQLREALERFRGRIIAIRSDEQTAKGIGVFSTQFFYVHPEKFDQTFAEFLDVLSRVLSSQFSSDATKFKTRTGLPHCIGIQLLPLIAEEQEPNRFYDASFAPMLSIAGHTALAKDEVRVLFGSGLAGTEDCSAHYIIYGKDKRQRINKDDLIFPKKSVLLIRGNELTVARLGFDHGYTGATCFFKHEPFLKLASALGHDIYFEAAILNDYDQTVVLTQLSPHTWESITIPPGEHLLRVAGVNQVIGNCVAQCDGVTTPFIWSDPHPGQLLYATAFSEDIGTLWKQNDPNAILLNGTDHGSLGGHGAGIYRELRIPFLTKWLSDDQEHILRWLGNVPIAVYADELNHIGGVVRLER
jgi:hypothetical protein